MNNSISWQSNGLGLTLPRFNRTLTDKFLRFPPEPLKTKRH